MYQVNLGDKILYYPGSEEAQIFGTENGENIGLAGEFKFQVPPDNPLYSELTSGKLITIYKNKMEVWRGEIREVKHDFAKIAYIYVVEDLAWLGDEFITPEKITNQTYAQRFQAAIAAYNSSRSSTPERQFLAGYITNVTSSSTCNWTTEYEWSILQSLRECICNAVSETGYIRVRRQKENGVIKRYIDIVKLSDYGVASDQPIEYGYNLLDYVKEMDYKNLTNVLTPYGDELDNTEVYEDYAQRLQGNTIQNAASIATYGRHARAVVFNGVTTAASLNALAASYLSRYCQPQLTMEVQAVDLAEIEAAEEIKIGDSVRIIAKPFAIDQRLYVTQIKRDIQNIDKNTITLSGHVQTGRTLTSQLAGTAKAVEEMPSESSILKAAKKNALAMLLDETQGGYVVFEYDSNNANMIAINICDAKTIESSTKRWKWSQNGLGYMERANTGAAWSTLKVAMNINGEIVADFVTTGTMLADRMRGGSLALGGSANGAYKNGVLIMYNSSNSEIGRWDRSGIAIYAGSIKLTKQSLTDANNGLYLGTDGIALGPSSKFKVTSAGAVSASDLSITGGSIKLTKQSLTDANNGLYLGTDGIALGPSSKFKVTNKGELTATFGTIGGFEITSDALGDHLGSTNCVGMKKGDKLFAWNPSGYSYVKWDEIYKKNGRIVVEQSGDEMIITHENLWCDAHGNVEWTGSDEKLKKDIEDLTLEEALELVTSVRPRKFEFKAEAGERYGFIAQEVREILPDDSNIEYESNGLCNIHYIDFVAPLCKIVKEQQAQIDALREEINRMKGETNG